MTKDAKRKRQDTTDLLAKLQQDMLAAIEKTPDDWDEIELARYVVHRAELFTRTSFPPKGLGARSPEPVAVTFELRTDKL